MRKPSAVDRLAERFYTEGLKLSPINCSYVGEPLRQDEYDDLSPAGFQAQYDLVKDTLAALDNLEAEDFVDAVTVAAMQERLGLMAETHEAGLDLPNLNNISAGLLMLREVLDIMPMATPDDWATIARRLHRIPEGAAGWFESQLAAAENGVRPAARQVRALTELCEGYAAENGFFAELPGRAQDLPPEVGELLEAGVAIARTAFTAAAERLGTEILPLAVEQDGVGPRRYELYSRDFLGTKIDPESTYHWGLEEVARLEALQEETAAKLRPGMSVPDAKKSLDEDPKYRVHGAAELQRWMQSKADEAIRELNGKHFDIPEAVQKIECCIAPTHDGGIYYTPPTDDFSRPGRMWWSIPEGEEDFGTWRELTTVYHEGVPGHHLQLGGTVFLKDTLNSWRRNASFTSGHGEGWALYAERLMTELGFMDDPADLLGQLDGEMMRACRVAIDIGLHCGFDAPAEIGGGAWTFDKAWEFFNSHVSINKGMALFELNRYFGWPGQASAYKVGQRTWLELREQVKAKQGNAFSLKDFHMRALAIGGVGLDTLKDAVLNG
jgi:uncharacterized protein (DUF885 family)